MATRRSHSIPQSSASRACDACRTRKIRCTPRLVDSANENGNRRGSCHEDGDASPSSLRCKGCYTADLRCTFDIPARRRGPRPKRRSGAEQPSPAAPLFSAWSVSPQTPLPADEGLTEGGVISLNVFEQQYARDEAVFPEDTPSEAVENTTFTPSSRVGGAELEGAYPSPNQASTNSIASRKQNPHPFSTDRLCPRPVIDAMICDWLDMLYPLLPVVHIPTFKMDLEAQRERSDPIFLALLFSLCAVLVAMVPSTFHRYQGIHECFRFQKPFEMIELCHELVMELRKPNYFDHSSTEKWTIAYLLSAANGNSGYLNRALMLAAEMQHHIRRLRCREVSSYYGLSKIEEQLRKRAFWMSSIGVYQEALLEPDTACQRQEEWFKHLDVNNLMPLGVDDEFIFEDVVLPQPENRAPIIVGLIVLSRIFYLAVPGYIPNTDEIGAIRPVFPSIVLEEADKTTAIEKWSILEARLQRLKYALDDVCEELSPWTTASETEFRSFIPNQSIRSRQFEIMRANIQVSHLWLQSTTLEEMITLSTMKTLETVPGNAPEAMQALWNEREDICRQLLHILYNISHDNLEPNGASLIYKIRQVAATLLDCPFEQQGWISRRANSYIQSFANLLSKVDEFSSKLMEGEFWASLDHQERRPMVEFVERGEGA